MTALLAHRGPDGSGIYAEVHAALGHRRLSIIDLAAGQQPMANEDGRLRVVYNGEIFNHASLRPELEAAGHRYATRCDTEAILHGYEQYGARCVERFRGMFAFAVWDSARRRLFCGRDRLGIKPFYYWTDGRTFAFASEIKALFEHPEISPAFEESTLPEYLSFGYLAGERTMFRGIRALLPGHTLEVTVQEGGLALEDREYWDVPVGRGVEERPEAEWVAECRARVEEAVRTRLMSDVPLGVFLSGGVDSSAIAALMKRTAAGRVQTFSVGYREAAFSELGYAEQVARYLDTDHHTVTVGREEFFEALPRLIWQEDEPITWPSSVSLYFVSKLAAERVKVVLTGEGSDELFGGYGRYRHYLWNQAWMGRYRMVPAGVRAWVRGFIGTSAVLPGGLRRKLGHTFLGLGESVESLYLDNFHAAFSEGGGAAYEGFLRYWEARAGQPTLERMLYADQKTYLVELLRKQDRMSMASSIESRVPLLDHELVEFAARVPAGLKIRGREGKYIFKRAVEDLVPRKITYRAKMGFPTPLREWLRTAEARPLFTAMAERGNFLDEHLERGTVEELVRRHQSGLHDCTDRLWRLLNLQIWADLFVTGKRNPEWAAAAR